MNSRLQHTDIIKSSTQYFRFPGVLTATINSSISSYHNETFVLAEIDSEQIDQYAREVNSFCEKDLIGNILSVLAINCTELDDYHGDQTRPFSFGIAHPTPSVQQALNPTLTSPQPRTPWPKTWFLWLLASKVTGLLISFSRCCTTTPLRLLWNLFINLYMQIL